MVELIKIRVTEDCNYKVFRSKPNRRNLSDEFPSRLFYYYTIAKSIQSFHMKTNLRTFKNIGIIIFRFWALTRVGLN
jgi:hypothetical protein